MHSVSFQEVVSVVLTIPTNKSPILDGFLIDLFKACWSFVGGKIVELVEESHSLQYMCMGLNSTLFTLIPKVGKSKDHRRFTNLSLCNFV